MKIQNFIYSSYYNEYEIAISECHGNGIQQD